VIGEILSSMILEPVKKSSSAKTTLFQNDSSFNLFSIYQNYFHSWPQQVRPEQPSSDHSTLGGDMDLRERRVALGHSDAERPFQTFRRAAADGGDASISRS
jgi:hypothetical protein